MKKYVFVLIIMALWGQFAFSQNRYDLVITEIMADPTPQIGLPNAEWIEIKNTSLTAINLLNFRLSDAGATSGAFPSFNLQPDSFVIVTTASQVAALSAFGTTISITSFPSLDNAGDQLTLRNATGRTIHALEYGIDWYQSTIKADGGFTLEMIDPKNPCSGFSNWRASNDLKGGTPGKKNSVDGLNKDATSPKIIRSFATDNQTIQLIFDEPLDSTKAALITSYSISDGIGTPALVIVNSPLFNIVILKTSTVLIANKVYTVTCNTLTDCSNNLLSNSNVRTGLATTADSLDIIVNEILFNPKPQNTDFVELYNRSNKIIDLKNVFINNRASNGALGAAKQIVLDGYLLFPGDFIVLTDDPVNIKQEFKTLNPESFITITSMPSYSDDKGNVIVQTASKIIDELKYSDKWHFALVNNTEGVSLERIDYNKPTNNADNWTSAASTVGYATPAYKNSQYLASSQAQAELTITPLVFSPDNDGFEDFAIINLKFAEPGYIANITIFDAAGRPIRILQKNATTAVTASFKWDGLNDKQQKVLPGIYIILTEVFNLKGAKKQMKQAVQVALKK